MQEWTSGMCKLAASKERSKSIDRETCLLDDVAQSALRDHLPFVIGNSRLPRWILAVYEPVLASL